MNVAGIFQLFATVAWIAFFGLIVIAIARASRGRSLKGSTTLIIVFLIVAVALTVVGLGVVFINPEERGVVVSALQPTGYRPQALTPGIHWIIPLLERVERYPVKKQTYTMSIAPLEGEIKGDDSITARTSDGQEIFIDASILYQIDPDKVIQVRLEWQDRYKDELVRPVARGIIRDVVSQYRVEEVVTSKRSEMTDKITEGLSQTFQENGLTLINFILRNITFSPEYAASVEQKQIAEQQAKQAAFVVEQRKQEALQAIEQAKGQAESVKIRAQGDADARLIQANAEAKALELIADALAGNKDLLTYQYILKLAPGIQVMLVPNNAPYLLPLPSLTSTPAPTAVP